MRPLMCFNAWLSARGHLDNGEDAAMLRQTRAWFEKNADLMLTYTHRAGDDHKAATDYIEKLSTAESSERRAGAWHHRAARGDLACALAQAAQVRPGSPDSGGGAAAADLQKLLAGWAAPDC